MKIAFFEIEPWEKDLFKEKLQGHELLFYERKLEDTDLSAIRDTDVLVCFIYSELSAARLERLPKLRFIATMSTGYDHIDIEACKKAGIKVSNVPAYGSSAVAEHTFALILALSRKLIPSFERVKAGSMSLENLRGFELAGKTIGIVGTGKIGRHVARIAKGFGMHILAYDKYPDEEFAHSMGIRYVSFDELLANSDIITLHVPLLPETRHMINRSNIDKIKKGAYLINTARGAIVETEALIKALDKGILAGVGLDVLEEECLIKEEKQILSKHFPPECLTKVVAEHILLTYPNVIITPHNAFNSWEALRRIVNTTIENIKGFIKGEPINVVC